MPTCCVKQCSARKTINQPTLTFHRFPAKEVSKKKWLDIIGTENINLRHKSKYVCSMHFDETSFNRTLDVVRLRDGALPSPHLLTGQIQPQSLLELSLKPQPISNVVTCDVPSVDVQESQNVLQSTVLACEGLEENDSSKTTASEPILKEHKKIINLRNKCVTLKKRIKMLCQRIRRRDKKIALYSNIIKDLRRKNIQKNEESFILVVQDQKTS